MLEKGRRIDLGLCAVVGWGAEATGREGGDEERDRIKAVMPLTLFSHAVINDKIHRTHRARQLTLVSLLLKQQPRVLGGGQFPNTSD